MPAERLWVITSNQHRSETAIQLPELGGDQIIGEPCGRDTAACIGLGAALIARRDPAAVMLVMTGFGFWHLHRVDPAEELMPLVYDDLRRLDAKVSFQLFDSARIFFEAQNLTDEPTRQYQAGNPNWLIQNVGFLRTAFGQPTSPPPDDPTQSFDDREQSYSGYAKANFGFDLGAIPVSGNFGLRLVDTEADSLGNTVVTDNGVTTITPVVRPTIRSPWYTGSLP